MSCKETANSAMERTKVTLPLIRMTEGKKRDMRILDGGSCRPVKNLKVNV